MISDTPVFGCSKRRHLPSFYRRHTSQGSVEKRTLASHILGLLSQELGKLLTSELAPGEASMALPALTSGLWGGDPGEGVNRRKGTAGSGAGQRHGRGQRRRRPSPSPLCATLPPADLEQKGKLSIPLRLASHFLPGPPHGVGRPFSTKGARITTSAPFPRKLS